MQKVPNTRTETAFEDYKGEYSRTQALAEANRCLFCADAPCIKACPTAIDIPQFIRKIATDNVRASARTIFDSNILGMSCARVCPVEVLCVGDCVYNHMDQPPIQIGRLQRYATDAAYQKGWRFYEAGPDSGKSVGLIGGGPASLAAAHELRLHGHACTIYEKRPVTGGLNTTGVAPYKMKADRSETEVDWILAIGGIEVQTGVEAGVHVTFAELERRHDAIFFGFGLGPDRYFDLPGKNLHGIFGAVDWIEQMKLGNVDVAPLKSVTVVGGGNTALDALRECLQLGVPEVTMIYRGDEPTMSGYHHEWKAARTEGARVIWRAQPIAFEGNQAVAGVRCVALDATRKAIPSSEFVVPTQLVLLAIGQSKLGASLAALSGLTIEDGRIITDDEGFTGRPGYYAGGDCRNGGKEVVNAAAEGKAAARAIHAFLSTGKGLRHA